MAILFSAEGLFNPSLGHPLRARSPKNQVLAFTAPEIFAFAPGTRLESLPRTRFTYAGRESLLGGATGPFRNVHFPIFSYTKWTFCDMKLINTPL